MSEQFELELVKPFYATKPAGAIQKKAINILGFCFDGTTSFRPGTRFGPDAIREVTVGLESYSPYLDDDLADHQIFDLGNLTFFPSRRDLTHEHFIELCKDKNLKKDKIKILTIGGEHSISYTPISRYLKDYPDLVVLHLDAHTDFRDGYLDEKFSHASVIRRIYDHFTKKNQLIQYGIRSGLKEEFVFLKKNKILKSSLEETLKAIESLTNERPIYLTLDLDFFDPAYLPGTGTPEAGGENFHNFMKIVKLLKKKNLVGADVVELSPQIDPTNNSSCFASKVCREVMLAMCPIK